MKRKLGFSVLTVYFLHRHMSTTASFALYTHSGCITRTVNAFLFWKVLANIEYCLVWQSFSSFSFWFFLFFFSSSSSVLLAQHQRQLSISHHMYVSIVTLYQLSVRMSIRLCVRLSVCMCVHVHVRAFFQFNTPFNRFCIRNYDGCPLARRVSSWIANQLWPLSRALPTQAQTDGCQTVCSDASGHIRACPDMPSAVRAEWPDKRRNDNIAIYNIYSTVAVSGRMNPLDLRVRWLCRRALVVAGVALFPRMIRTGPKAKHSRRGRRGPLCAVPAFNP